MVCTIYDFLNQLIVKMSSVHVKTDRVSRVKIYLNKQSIIDHLCLTPGKQLISPARLQDACANTSRKTRQVSKECLIMKVTLKQSCKTMWLNRLYSLSQEFAMNAGYLSVTCTAYVMNSPLFLISSRAQHYIYFPQCPKASTLITGPLLWCPRAQWRCFIGQLSIPIFNN